MTLPAIQKRCFEMEEEIAWMHTPQFHINYITVPGFSFHSKTKRLDSRKWPGTYSYFVLFSKYLTRQTICHSSEMLFQFLFLVRRLRNRYTVLIRDEQLCTINQQSVFQDSVNEYLATWDQCSRVISNICNDDWQNSRVWWKNTFPVKVLEAVITSKLACTGV